jgi:hypothetical protein
VAATDRGLGGVPKLPEPDAAERIARLSATLPLRRDADRVRAVLAEAFVAHTDELWPAGADQGSPEWIAANVDGIVATLELLFKAAAEDHPGSAEFLDRLSWLPPLIHNLEKGRTRPNA